MQRLLFITSRFPYPPIGGDRLRAFHLARLLSREFEVDLLGLGEVSQEEVQVFRRATGVRSAEAIPHTLAQALIGAGRAVVSGAPLQVGYFRNTALDAAVARRAEEADVVICHLIRAADAWQGQRDIPAVLDLCDAISNNYAQVVRNASAWKPWTWISRIEGPRVRRFEQQQIARFNLLTLVSQADAASLVSPPERTLLLSQGVDLSIFEYRPPSARHGQALALIGKMDTYPNRSGALWFAREVLPALAPGTRLKLIGDCPPALRREFERWPGVEVTGRVPDIAAACDGCYAGVAPLDIATGVQNKVLEYFALGLPAVISPSVTRGLMPASSGCYLVADSPAQWVEALAWVEQDRAGTDAMAERARRYVEQHHDWDRIGEAFVQRVRQSLIAAASARSVALLHAARS